MWHPFIEVVVDPVEVDDIDENVKVRQALLYVAYRYRHTRVMAKLFSDDVDVTLPSFVNVDVLNALLKKPLRLVANSRPKFQDGLAFKWDPH